MTPNNQPLKFAVTGKRDMEKSFEDRFPWTAPKRDFVISSIREVIANSKDAGATAINFILEHGRLFAGIDNGSGFDKDDRDGFVHLDMSKKRGKKQFTGQHGTGRTRALSFSNSITAFTVAGDTQGRFLKFPFTRELLKKIYCGEEPVDFWVETAKPKWWPLAKGQTGTAMVLDIPDEHWDTFPSAQVLIDHLAEELSPSLAKIITVNGKNLKERSLLKNPFQQEFSVEDIAAVLGPETAEALGHITVDFYLPKEWASSDAVCLGGAINRVCPLSQFLRGVSKKNLAESVPTLLTKPGIGGVIFIPGLNDFVAQSRHELEGAVYNGFDAKIIGFLEHVLGPVIDKEFKRRQTEGVRVRQRQLLVQFASTFRDAFGTPKKLSKLLLEKDVPGDGEKVMKPKGKDERLLVVSPSRYSGFMGEQVEFEVVRFEGDSKDLVWDDSGIKEIGEISVKTGSQTSFSGTDIGKGKLRVYSKKDSAISVDVNIAIVTSAQLGISPSDITVQQGTERRFRARNHQSITGKVQWRLLDNAGGFLSLRNTLGVETYLNVQEGCPLGSYLLECSDSKNSHLKAHAEIEVVSGSNPVITIDKMNYRLVTADEGQLQIAVSVQEFSNIQGDEAVIEVNYSHPDFKCLETLRDTEGVAANALLFNSVMMIHLQLLVQREELRDYDVWNQLQRRQTQYLQSLSDKAK